MVSPEFFMDIILPAALWICGRLSLTEMSTRNISWVGGLGRQVSGADNLTTFMCRLSRNLGASTFWACTGIDIPFSI